MSLRRLHPPIVAALYDRRTSISNSSHRTARNKISVILSLSKEQPPAAAQIIDNEGIPKFLG
jgi:hypothetical protein